MSVVTTSAIPLVYVEVDPQLSLAAGSPSLTCASVKLQLQRYSLRSALQPGIDSLMIEWDKNATQVASGRLTVGDGLNLALGHEHPLITNPWPCVVRGYAVRVTDMEGRSPVSVDESTLVCIRSPGGSYKAAQVGEVETRPFDKAVLEEIVAAQNPSAVEQLTLQMRRLLARPQLIGTTVDAADQERRRKSIRRAMSDYRGEQSQAPCRQPVFDDGALIVHSPDYGAGKTALVTTVATLLGCRTHIVRPGPLLAKFGTYADAGLSTLIHAAVLAGAVRNTPVCIVLDHLDAMMPGGMTGSSANAGDSAAPALNGIASYLSMLTRSVGRRQEVPFPVQNPLYNLGGKHGVMLTVRLCVVAIVTCPDDGWQSNGGSILHSMQAGLYRLKSLSVKTRLGAFTRALRGVSLEENLVAQLPILTARATWARGAVFGRVGRVLAEKARQQMRPITVEDFTAALVQQSRGSRAVSVEFSAAERDAVDHFASVGGSQEAKIALEEALALNPHQKRMLEKFGLSPPTGVLLFGCPGTGKTLLAKAVAKLLKARGPHSTSLGGAFISLSSSDIVRAEVGSGEKIVLAAFETARDNSPSVIFIDEFQALFTERSSSGSSRLTTTLLQCMDDVTQWRDAGHIEKTHADEYDEDADTTSIVVLAATNTPWMVDKAFLRPGRFDRAVHVRLPAFDDRVAILRVHVRKMKLAGCGVEAVSGLCEQLARQTEGFSGADLAALCRAAAIRCVLQSNEAIEEHHFLAARELDVYPSTSIDLCKRIEQWRA